MPYSLSTFLKEPLAYWMDSISYPNISTIRVRLPNGKWEVLATSLLDQQRYPACEFAALYGQRWGVEEAFKLLKHRLDLEGFSGELPHAIEQEIYAKALMHNIAQALCSEAARQIEEEKRANWQVNRAYAVKNVGAVVVNWLKGCKHQLARITQSLIDTLAITLEQIRPGRTFPRKHAIGGAQRPRKAYR